MVGLTGACAASMLRSAAQFAKPTGSCDRNTNSSMHGNHVTTSRDHKPRVFIGMAGPSEWRVPLDSRLAYLCEPVLSTLRAGFRALEPTVPHVLEVDLNASTMTIRSLGLGVGDVLVWVASTALQRVPWEHLRSTGVYTVYYQSEPMGVGSSARSLIPHKHREPTFCACASIHCDELWDFSLDNVDACRNATLPKGYEKPLLRHVPLTATLDEEAPKLLRQPDTANATLTFFGSSHFGRGPCLRAIERDLKHPLLRVYDVFDASAYEQFLHRADSGLYLNLHKECVVNPSAEHLTHGARPVTWRNPKLLNARGLIISEPCYWRDEAEYAGLVDFVPLDKIGATAEALLCLSAEQRLALAIARYECFRARFHPLAIFLHAGIHSMLAGVAGRGGKVGGGS